MQVYILTKLAQLNAIIAIHCFQFWKDPDRSITEIGLVMRPEGRNIIVFRDHFSNPPVLAS
jgi:hypothetical protein